MIDRTVPVPDERTAEFYLFFGLWLAGSLNLPTSLESSEGSPEPRKPTPWANTDQDLADAVTLWRKYSPKARAVFGLLMDSPGKTFTGEEIAQTVNIPNGAHGVAGVIAWPGRHGAMIGRGLPTESRMDQETMESLYWMPSTSAELFKAARAKVEAGD